MTGHAALPLEVLGSMRFPRFRVLCECGWGEPHNRAGIAHGAHAFHRGAMARHQHPAGQNL